MADALATLASMYKVSYPNLTPLIQLTSIDMPAYIFSVEVETDDKPWYHDIKHFLQTQ